MALHGAYHLPELIRSRQLETGPLHNERLLANCPVLKLVLDVGEPWLGAPGVSLDVLFVGEVVLGLGIESANSLPALSNWTGAIPPTPGLAGDPMPERGWMTSRDAMCVVSRESDCLASVARDVESGERSGWENRGHAARWHGITAALATGRCRAMAREGRRRSLAVGGPSRRRGAFFFAVLRMDKAV